MIDDLRSGIPPSSREIKWGSAAGGRFTKVKSLSRGLEAEDRVYHLILCQSLWELQDIVDVMMGEDSM